MKIINYQINQTSSGRKITTDFLKARRLFIKNARRMANGLKPKAEYKDI